MYHCVLRNATIADGTGAPLYRGDICIQDGKIAEILPRYSGQAENELDVNGLVTAPGFIDIHTHSDTIPFQTNTNPESKLYQGVTLEITGNCGISHLPAPKETYRFGCFRLLLLRERIKSVLPLAFLLLLFECKK